MTSLELVPALGSYGPGDRNRRDGTSRGVAVAAISRRSGKQAVVSTLQGAPFGVPPPSLRIESEVYRNSHSRKKDLRAAMTLARSKGTAAHAQTCLSAV